MDVYTYVNMCMYIHKYTPYLHPLPVYVYICIYTYGVATIGMLLKIIGLFCKTAL